MVNPDPLLNMSSVLGTWTVGPIEATSGSVVCCGLVFDVVVLVLPDTKVKLILGLDG